MRAIFWTLSFGIMFVKAARGEESSTIEAPNQEVDNGPNQEVHNGNDAEEATVASELFDNVSSNAENQNLERGLRIDAEVASEASELSSEAPDEVGARNLNLERRWPLPEIPECQKECLVSFATDNVGKMDILWI